MKSIITIMCVVVAITTFAQTKSQKDSLYKRNYEASRLYIFKKDPHLKPFMDLKVFVGHNLSDGKMVQRTVYLIGFTPEKVIMDTAICGVREIAITPLVYEKIKQAKQYRSVLNLFIDSNGILQSVIINWQPAWNAYANWSCETTKREEITPLVLSKK